MSAGKAKTRPQRAPVDQRPLFQVQKALAMAKAIRIAADYPDDGLDLADAVAGLVIVLEGATVLLDSRRAAP